MKELNFTSLTPELERVVDYGTKVDVGGFTVSLGDSPLAVPLAEVFEELGKPVDLSLYSRFNVWVVPHRISIQRKKGHSEPTAVGLDVEYLNGTRTCAVVALLPTSQFFTFGKAGMNVQASGKMSASGDLSPLVNSGESELTTPKLVKGGLEFAASADSSVTFSFQATAVTPYIAATGVGSSACEWRFDKHEQALFGRDIETWSILVLPKSQTSLEYRMRYYMNFRTLFFPTRVESEWETINCPLVAKAKPVAKSNTAAG